LSSQSLSSKTVTSTPAMATQLVDRRTSWLARNVCAPYDCAATVVARLREGSDQVAASSRRAQMKHDGVSVAITGARSEPVEENVVKVQRELVPV
jgi:hypothetical protein